MELEQLMLGFLGTTETAFECIAVKETDVSGIPIGQGKCKAIRLQLNEFTLNSTDGTQIANRQIYFGDSQAQEIELQRGAVSHLIVTDRLEKVFVRNPSATIAQVQIWIYR